MTAQTIIRRYFGKAGSVAGWNVLIEADAIRFAHDGELGTGISHRHDVPNYGTSIGELSSRPGFALGWVRMEDDAEILYFYDRNDDGFGYALNVTDSQLSEWGYSPFRYCRHGAPIDAYCGGCQAEAAADQLRAS
jgi:hypothetical protein